MNGQKTERKQASHCRTLQHIKQTLAQFLLQGYIHKRQFGQYWQAKNIVKRVMKQKNELVTKERNRDEPVST